MFVLLKDTDKEFDKGVYLYTPYYDKDVERSLIELYYRGIAEGLVEYSVEKIDTEDIEVKDLKVWIDEKQNIVRNVKILDILENLKGKIFTSTL